MINQERIYRFSRFCLVGGTVAAVDFSSVWLLSHFLNPLVAVSVAYFVGVTCHFLLNKFWVFRCRRNDYIRQLMQYVTVVLSSWVVTIATVHFCLSSITHNILIAKLFAVPPATLVAFTLMQFFVFRNVQPSARKNQSPAKFDRIPDRTWD
ncbi:MAG: GtrA family protein [Verrucomicrobia bacterium]|nr:GtrA family protein [Verrucomicrobiota bacterium]MBV8378564.1 GtrA family protein [Verrucomicrobiota bacterium]